MVLYFLYFLFRFVLFYLFIYLFIYFPYLLRTGLFHCGLHHTSPLIVEKVLTLILQFWRQMVVQRLGESNQMLWRRDNVVHNICIQNGWQYW